MFNATNFTSDPYNGCNTTLFASPTAWLWCPSDGRIQGLSFSGSAGHTNPDGTFCTLRYTDYAACLGAICYFPQPGDPYQAMLSASKGMFFMVGCAELAARKPGQRAAVEDRRCHGRHQQHDSFRRARPHFNGPPQPTMTSTAGDGGSPGTTATRLSTPSSLPTSSPGAADYNPQNTGQKPALLGKAISGGESDDMLVTSGATIPAGPTCLRRWVGPLHQEHGQLVALLPVANILGGGCGPIYSGNCSSCALEQRRLPADGQLRPLPTRGLPGPGHQERRRSDQRGRVLRPATSAPASWLASPLPSRERGTDRAAAFLCAGRHNCVSAISIALRSPLALLTVSSYSSPGTLS